MDIPLPAAESKEELDDEAEEIEEEIDGEDKEEEEDEKEADEEESEEEQKKGDTVWESANETSENEVVVSPRHSRAKSVAKVSKVKKGAFIKAL